MSGKVVGIAVALLIAGVVLPIALGSTGIGALLVSSGPFGSSGDFASYRNIMLIAFGLGVPLMFLVWILRKGGIKIGG